MVEDHIFLSPYDIRYSLPQLLHKNDQSRVVRFHFLKDRKQRYVQRRRKMLPSWRDKNCQEYIVGIFSTFITAEIVTRDNLIFENNSKIFFLCIWIFHRAWKCVLKNMKLMAIYWKFMNSNAHRIYSVSVQSNYTWCSYVKNEPFNELFV